MDIKQWWEKQRAAIFNYAGSQQGSQPTSRQASQSASKAPATGGFKPTPVSATTTQRSPDQVMSNAPLRSPDQIVAGAPTGIQRTAPQPAQAERPNPFALYYSPDQVVDEQGNMRSGLSPYAPFRGESAYAKVMGFTPPLPPQYFWPEEGGVGSGSGGGSGQPFVYNQAPPAPPSLERLQPQSFNMQDPYPAPQRGPEPAPFQTQGAPPEPYRRDNAKYRKLLGY